MLQQEELPPHSSTDPSTILASSVIYVEFTFSPQGLCGFSSFLLHPKDEYVGRLIDHCKLLPLLINGRIEGNVCGNHWENWIELEYFGWAK